jgi:hypothetical protein
MRFMVDLRTWEDLLESEEVVKVTHPRPPQDLSQNSGGAKVNF